MKGNQILFPVWAEEVSQQPSNWPQPNKELRNNIVNQIWGEKSPDKISLIATMSLKYKLITNQSIVDNCIEALKELGLQGEFNQKHSGEVGPDVYLITIDTDEKVIDENNKVIFKQLINKNSYNGYTSWKLYIGFMHAFCTNGMISMSTEVELSNVHKKGIIKDIKNAISKTLEKDNFFQLLSNAKDRKSPDLYEKTMEKLAKILTKKEMEAFNLTFSFLNLKHQPVYELYSALTWFNSHIITPIGSKYMDVNKLINNMMNKLQ